MKAIEEIGKGFIALANLTLVLIFFKEFMHSTNLSLLIYGLFFSIVLYSLGFKLIQKSEER